MAPKRIIIKKKVAKVAKSASDTYCDAPADVPQLRTRCLKAPKPPKIIDSQALSKSADEPAMFKFYCIRCGQKLSAQTDWAGRDVQCTTCNSTIVIPDPP